MLLDEAGDAIKQPPAKMVVEETRTVRHRHHIRLGPATPLPAAAGESSGHGLPRILGKPLPRRIDLPIHQPVDPAFRPFPHHEVEEIACIDGASFAKHVVMLIDMEDELRRVDDAPPDRMGPDHHGFAVMFNNGIHGTASPLKEFSQPLLWFGTQAKVIEVDIQNRGHSSPRVMAQVGHYSTGRASVLRQETTVFDPKLRDCSQSPARRMWRVPGRSGR